MLAHMLVFRAAMTRKGEMEKGTPVRKIQETIKVEEPKKR